MTTLEEDEPVAGGCGEEGSQDEGFFTDTVRRGSRATFRFMSGLADAVGSGLDAYAESLTNDNIMRFSLNNGMIEGTIAGYARFFEELAGATRRVQDDIKGAREPMRRKKKEARSDSFDYERLAKMVAEQLRDDRTKKAGGTDPQGKAR